MQLCKAGIGVRAAVLLGALWVAAGAWAQPAPQAAPAIAAFARIPAVTSVSLSPDGRYLAYISGVEGRQVVVTVDRQQAQPKPVPVLANHDSERYTVRWCSWANDTRLLCGIRAQTLLLTGGGQRAPGRSTGGGYEISRLVALNADGSDMKVLMQQSRVADAQFLDRVLDWTPDEPKSVLMQADDNGDGYPSVFELDVYTGKLAPREPSRMPILSFVSDGRGAVRLGYGLQGTTLSYFARLQGDTEWRQLARFEATSSSAAFRPIAVVPGSNRAYATGDFEGRSALWEIDLADREPPKVVARHPRVDVEDPMFTADGQLRGVRYEAEKPKAAYLDPTLENLVKQLARLRPDVFAGSFTDVADVSRDDKVFVVRVGSDVDTAYYVVDTRKPEWSLVMIGRQYPELPVAQLARMQPIDYPAADGTRIPGYLTLPPGSDGKNLPLVLMPHGGPIARDSWGFDFLAQFLASRGYAVLQMNFRGSSGYGEAWLGAAHQDWGGLTYSDIRDGARWAIAQGIADPARVGIVGWSFGGYAALLGATRDSDLFRCAASIAGVSDLNELSQENQRFLNGRIARLQIGTDRAKLRDDSPRRHAEQVRIPLLIVHGSDDVTVEVEQSRLMAAALGRAGGKDYQLLEIRGGGHQLWRQDERMQLLGALETFLASHLLRAQALPGG